MPSLLEIFCGRGGWSKSFAARGWRCVGVDVAALGYPFEFIQADALTLTPEFIAGFDAVVMSPPCEEFARAWLEAWKREFNGDDEDPEWYWIPPNEPDGNGEPPSYLHDANAILPLLEKHDWNCFRGKIGYEVEVEVEVASSVKPFGIAPTFCRAACIAVLKAHGLWQQSSDVSP